MFKYFTTRIPPAKYELSLFQSMHCAFNILTRTLHVPPDDECKLYVFRRMGEEKEDVLHWAMKLFVDTDWSKNYPRMAFSQLFEIEGSLGGFLLACANEASISSIGPDLPQHFSDFLLDRRMLELSLHLLLSKEVDRSKVVLNSEGAIDVLHHFLSTARRLDSKDVAASRVAIGDLRDLCDGDTTKIMQAIGDALVGVDLLAVDQQPWWCIAKCADIIIDIVHSGGPGDPSFSNVGAYGMFAFGLAFMKLGLYLELAGKRDVVSMESRLAFLLEVHVRSLNVISHEATDEKYNDFWFWLVEMGLLRTLLSCYPTLLQKRIAPAEALQPAEALLSRLPVFHFDPDSLLSFEAGMVRIPSELHSGVLSCPLGPTWDLYCSRLLERMIFFCYFELAGIWAGCWMVRSKFHLLLTVICLRAEQLSK